jgi:two-component system response regulator YesN
MNIGGKKPVSQLINLLIAEDEDRVRTGLEHFMREKAGFVDNVYCAENGRQALDMIILYRPEVMILDIKMPKKNGLEVMRDAKAAGIMPKTIIMSGYDEFDYAQQALRYGAIDYLLKPCRSTDILKAVQKAAADLGKDETAPGSGTGNNFVDEAIYYMERHYHEDVTLTAVAEVIGITPSYLSTLFGRTVGCGFADYLNNIRIQRACDYFVDNSLKTYEVAYKVGFRDEKYFSSVFKKIKGLNPSDYRKSLRASSAPSP